MLSSFYKNTIACIYFGYSQNSLEEEDLAPNIRTKQPIVIATVACSKQKPSDGTDPLETEKRKKFYEEVAVMMKSVILSAKYNQVTSLKFHIFLEHVEASEIILSQFKVILSLYKRWHKN